MPFSEFMEFITNTKTLWALGIFSVFTFIASLMVIPWLIVRIPVDYFAGEERHFLPWSDQHLVIRWILLVMKNLVGVVFIILGIIMLFIPGQGLLTILVGIIFLNFPGKYRLERWFIQLHHVRRTVDWLRRRSGRQPLIFRD